MNLNSSVRLIKFQFSFSNSDAVPRSLFVAAPETEHQADDRQKEKGYQLPNELIAPTETCSLFPFVDDIEWAGYELVGAAYQLRKDQKDRTGKRHYHMVRFVFARHEFATPSAEFLKVRGWILEDFRLVCSEAFWRVRAYKNPFLLNYEEVAGQFTLSINLEVRVPRFRSDGSPVTQWEKSEFGERIGDAPVPIRPNHYLSIMGGLKLVHQLPVDEMIGDLAK